jgi:hypothetical protein
MLGVRCQLLFMVRLSGESRLLSSPNYAVASIRDIFCGCAAKSIEFALVATLVLHADYDCFSLIASKYYMILRVFDVQPDIIS